ncbi:WEB family protein At4g27595, chloroplastic isoform X2 [Cephus cinctus]|uniref:WEB family protein At4g27595, chloroplastic isoform X2 n=1 Tax=Cephus cinctus TaxID=211228 RepID=A0AAJ7C956_CEPCN|nr:WEB family protein At4g27595, chloroplastic isoform X2 [Cephus cinctus]
MSLELKKFTINSSAPGENDSLKDRRSSLQVNLSYVSSLTNCSVEDHDVDSLDKTNMTNDKTVISSKEVPGQSLFENVTRRKNSQRKIKSITSVLQNCNIDNTDKDSSNETNKINATNNDILLNTRNKNEKKLHAMNVIMTNLNNDNEMQNERIMNTLYKKSTQNTKIQKNNVNMLNIENKDQYLNESCRDLKDAILSKTMQLFDKQNEYSIRTSQVMVQKELMEAFVPIERLKSPRIRLIVENEDQVTMSDGSSDSPVQMTSMRFSDKCITQAKQKSVDEPPETEDRLEDNESIISTPKKSIGKQNMSTVKCRIISVVRTKRLFEEQNKSDERRARNILNVSRSIDQNKHKTMELDSDETTMSDDGELESPRKRLMTEDIALQKCLSNKNIINSPALDKEISQHQSPILTGTNRRLSSSKVSLSLRSKELNPCSSSTLRHDKTSLSDNRNNDILPAAPSVCSSYVEEYIERMNQEQQETNDKVTSERNTGEDISELGITVNGSIPMEITEVQGLGLFAKGSASSKNSNLDEPVIHCKTNNEMRSSKLIIHDDSNEADTYETSLNVNTSLDRTVDSGISCNKQFGSLKTIKQFSKSAMELNNIIEPTTEKCLKIVNEPKIGKVPTNPLFKEPATYLKSVLNEEEDSNSTVRTSLNVNTSIDGRFSLAQAENLYLVEESPDLETEDKSEKSNVVNMSMDEEELASDKRESTSTVRTSLQMNTSLDNLKRCSLVRNKNNKRVQQLSTIDDETTEPIDQSSSDKSAQINLEKKSDDDCRYFNSLEDMSLIERLRNISRTKRISSTSSSRPSTRNEEAQISVPGTNKNENIRSNRQSLKDGVYFIEGTPFPVSRSVLLKSQIKYNSNAKQLDTQKFPSAKDDENLDMDKDSSSSVGSYHCLEDRLRIKRFTKSQRPYQKKHPTSWVRTRSSVLLDTIVLDNSSSREDSSDGEKNKQTIAEHFPDANEKTENDKEEQPNDKVEKSKKKKLLPLRETSRLISLSPVVMENHSPKEPRIKRKYNKKQNKGKVKIKTVHKPASQKEIDDDTASDENLQTVYTQTKKPKKRRKVISKKIVVKKITNLDIIEQLEANSQKSLNHDNLSGRARSSVNYFQPEKNILCNWRKRKTEKIVIVTTGLSNEQSSSQIRRTFSWFSTN